MKGALWMGHISLKKLRGGGLGGSSFTGDPGRYVKGVSGYGHLTPFGPLSIRGELGMWGARVPGTLIGELRRAVVVEHLTKRDSMKGALREGSFTGEPEK